MGLPRSKSSDLGKYEFLSQSSSGKIYKEIQNLTFWVYFSQRFFWVYFLSELDFDRLAPPNFLSF